MSKRKPDPSAIRAGDFLHLTVPHNRHLDWGVYRAKVESLAAKPRNVDGQSYNCCINLTDGVLDFDDINAILVHFKLTIFNHESLKGVCFIADDQFPVEFRHEPNIERRIMESLPGVRLPYKDQD